MSSISPQSHTFLLSSTAHIGYSIMWNGPFRCLSGFVHDGRAWSSFNTRGIFLSNRSDTALSSHNNHYITVGANNYGAP